MHTWMDFAFSVLTFSLRSALFTHGAIHGSGEVFLAAANRKTTAEFIARERLSAIIRTNDAEVARKAMRAAVDGGFRIVEFTLTTPGALTLVGEFVNNKNLVVGAGTVMTVDQVREAKAAGAHFVVSPICDPEVVAEAAACGLISTIFRATLRQTLATWRSTFRTPASRV